MNPQAQQYLREQTLTQREAIVLIARESLTPKERPSLRELAEQFKISREKIRGLEYRARTKILTLLERYTDEERALFLSNLRTTGATILAERLELQIAKMPRIDPDPLLSSVESLDLGDHAIPILNILIREKIKTIGELCTHTETDLRRLPKMGPKFLQSIREALAYKGLALKLDAEAIEAS